MILMPALSRAEAVERRRLLDVRSVVVELDLTRGEEIFGSRTEIRFACTEPGAATFLDVKPHALLRVALNGQELDPAALADGRFPLDELAAENVLLVEADMAYSRTGEGMHRFTDPEDGEAYVYTQAFLDDGPRFFASFDQPDLKAPYRMAVRAPEGWTVVGNTRPVQRPGGVWEFETTQPISSYLVAVVAGPLHSVHAEHDGIPLGLHCRRSLGKYLDADAEEILDITRRCLDHYHAIFREWYPFGSYDQCFVPEFNAGAMENPGCVTFREEFVFRAAVTEAQREERGIVIAHEMAHMWFGDLVTMRWWNDLWLNESFAEFMGQQTMVEATRFGDAWTGFAAGRKPWGYAADQRPSTHPVAAGAAEVADTAQALQNFDGISYAKGASVLRQLVAWLGEEHFLAGLNEHFSRHRFGNASLEDLLDSLAAVSGRDVHGWAERWLRTSGVDTLRVERGTGGGTSAAILQHSPDGVLRPHLIEVGCYDRLPGGGVTLRKRLSVELPGEERGAELPGVGTSPLLVPNDTDLGYAKVRLDEDSWRIVREELGGVPDSLARAVLWAHVRDLVRDAELPGEEYLALLEPQLAREDSVRLVESALAFAQDSVADCYLPPARRPAALAVIAAACRALLRRSEGEPRAADVRLVAVRGLIDASATPAELADLRQWLSDGTVPGGPVLDAELRRRVLYRLCAAGEAGEPEIAEELRRDPSDTGAEGAARCRAALPEPEAKERAWAAAMSGDLSAYLLKATFQGFWQPAQAGLLAPWLPRWFAEAPEAARRGPAVARVLTLDGFPAYAAEPEVAEMAEECLRRDDLTAALRRGLVDRADDLRRALRAREAE